MSTSNKANGILSRLVFQHKIRNSIDNSSYISNAYTTRTTNVKHPYYPTSSNRFTYSKRKNSSNSNGNHKDAKNKSSTNGGGTILPPTTHSSQIFNNTNEIMTKPLSIFNNSINLSTLFGHTAFILMGMAYLTKDILLLRCTAIGSITSSMIFQYYRPQPLIIPLRWNAIFLSINSVMAYLLMKERLDAENMSDELNDIYHQGSFEERHFGKVEFHKLFALGRREVRQRGDFLKKAGVISTELCYIVNGSATIVHDHSKEEPSALQSSLQISLSASDDDIATVNHEGSQSTEKTQHGFSSSQHDNDELEALVLGNVEEHDFTGELDFIRYTKTNTNNTVQDSTTSVPVHENNIIKDGDTNDSMEQNNDLTITTSTTINKDSKEGPRHVSTESIIANSDTITLWIWDYVELKQYLAENKAVSNSLFAYISYELKEKLEDCWRDKIRDDKEKAHIQQLAVNYLMNQSHQRNSEVSSSGGKNH